MESCRWRLPKDVKRGSLVASQTRPDAFHGDVLEAYWLRPFLDEDNDGRTGGVDPEHPCMFARGRRFDQMEDTKIPILERVWLRQQEQGPGSTDQGQASLPVRPISHQTGIYIPDDDEDLWLLGGLVGRRGACVLGWVLTSEHGISRS